MCVRVVVGVVGVFPMLMCERCGVCVCVVCEYLMCVCECVRAEVCGVCISDVCVSV